MTQRRSSAYSEVRIATKPHERQLAVDAECDHHRAVSRSDLRVTALMAVLDMRLG
jgi:hypothetical protein